MNFLFARSLDSGCCASVVKIINKQISSVPSSLVRSHTRSFLFAFLILIPPEGLARWDEEGWGRFCISSNQQYCKPWFSSCECPLSMCRFITAATIHLSPLREAETLSGSNTLENYHTTPEYNNRPTQISATGIELSTP
jgi:hypothetical protein